MNFEISKRDDTIKMQTIIIVKPDLPTAEAVMADLNTRKASLEKQLAKCNADIKKLTDLIG